MKLNILEWLKVNRKNVMCVNHDICGRSFWQEGRGGGRKEGRQTNLDSKRIENKGEDYWFNQLWLWGKWENSWERERGLLIRKKEPESSWYWLMEDCLMKQSRTKDQQRVDFSTNWLQRCVGSTKNRFFYLLVTEMCRFNFPSSTTAIICSGEVTNRSVIPLT